MPSMYGVVETDEDGRVRRFLEKPKPDETTVQNINAGTYVLEPKVLDLIPEGENYSFEYGLFPEAAEAGRSFLCAHSAAHLLDGHRHARALPAGASRHAGQSRHAYSPEGSPREL